MKKTLFVISLLSVSLFGCGSNSSVEEFVAETQKAPPSPLPKTPSVKPYEAAKFVNNGIDPFHIVIKKATTQDNAPDKGRKKELLESVQLDTVKYIGSVSRFGKMFAMVKVDGIVHLVKVGDHLGLDYGEIKAIEEGKIVLIEKIDGADGWTDRETFISITSDSASDKKK